MLNNNLSALIIGPTDKTKIFRFGKIKKENYENYKSEIGKVLAKNLSTIYLIPSEGIPLDFAKAYRQAGGSEVIGVLPKGGHEASEEYFKFCNKIEEIDGDWSVLNTCLSLKSGLMIGFGLSPGTLVEIAYSKHHKKYLKKDIPIFLDERTISQRLNPELEEEVDLTYFSLTSELNSLLKKLK